MRELNRFIDQPLTTAQLNAAKKQLCGQIGISTDASEGYALALGKTYAHYHRHRSVTNIIEAIKSVSVEQIQQVAADVYATNHLTTLIYQ